MLRHKQLISDQQKVGKEHNQQYGHTVNWKDIQKDFVFDFVFDV